MPISIGLLNPCFWPEVRRGSERHIHDLATGLGPRGFEPTLITGFGRTPPPAGELSFAVRGHRRPPEALLRRLGVDELVTHAPGSYRALKRLDPDLAHAFYPVDSAIAGRWSRRTGRPLIFSIMGIPMQEGIRGSRARERLWRAAINNADQVVALSEVAARATGWLIDREVKVINLGVDLARFEASRERAPEPTVLCPAAIDEPRKRVPLLADAVESLNRGGAGIKLVLPRPRQPDLAARLGLERPFIEFRDLGYLGQELVDAYSQAWVTALASRHEGFGLILIESLACGTPAIGAREGGVPEVLREAERAGVAWMFEAERLEHLAGSIASALERVEAGGHEAACRAAVRHFDIERVRTAHDQLYRAVLADRAPS